MSSGLKDQLKEKHNASQQAAIATVVCPGQALFSLLQVSSNCHYYYACRMHLRTQKVFHVNLRNAVRSFSIERSVEFHQQMTYAM